MNFGRVITAMVTPFDAKGNIDFNKTVKLVKYLLENGSDGLIISGTTGEAPTLSNEEKIALFRHVVKIVDGRVPVIAGTGSYNTYASVDLTRKAEEVGVDGIMLVTPYYNTPSQEGLYKHFKTIAEKTALPVMLSNAPGRSVANIDAETVVALSKIKNIVAIQDASGDMSHMTAIATNTAEDFSLYSGDDSLILQTLTVGGVGAVSVASHIIGNELQDMIQAYENGDTKKATQLHQQLFPIMKGMQIAPNPAPVKTALQLIGFDVGSVRLPLVATNVQEREHLVKLLL